jgi:hypothetical protein
MEPFQTSACSFLSRSCESLLDFVFNPFAVDYPSHEVGLADVQNTPGSTRVQLFDTLAVRGGGSRLQPSHGEGLLGGGWREAVPVAEASEKARRS